MVKLIHRCEDFALIGALITMLAIALMQIVLRNFFDSGVLWAETFSRVLVLWLAMLGAMVATRERIISILMCFHAICSLWRSR